MLAHTDKLWDDSVSSQTSSQREAMKAYRQAKLYSCFVEGHDGTKLAVDVLLPESYHGTRALPCVLYQARYTRGVYLRFPFSLMSKGRPYDLINFSQKAEFLLAGYAIVSMDFRGTGASFGQWRLPWSREERADSLSVLDWMQGQQWCNGKVVLCGQSYDATAALFTASMHHPAVKGVVALYPFWDMYNDIAIPGGIAMKSFSEAWARFCQAVDYNDYSLLPYPVRQILSLISKGCNPVVSYDGARQTATSFTDQLKSASGLWRRLFHRSKPSSSQSADHQQPTNGQAQAPTVEANNAEAGSGGRSNAGVARPASQPSILDSDHHCYRSWARGAAEQQQGTVPVIDGNTIPTRGSNSKGVSASSLHIGIKRHYKEAGKRKLSKAIAEHDTWDSAGAMKKIRFTDQKASERDATTADVSLCTRATELSQARVPLQLVSGWFDATAAAAINLFVHCGQAPGSELVLGPWSHGGLTDQDARKPTSFSQSRHSVAFMNKCCNHNQPAQQPDAQQQATLDPSAANVKPKHQAVPKSDRRLPFPQQQQQELQHGLGNDVACDDSCSQEPFSLPDQHHKASNGHAHTNSPDQNIEQATSGSHSSKAVQDCAVHYVLMGQSSHRGWRHTPSWPPPDLQSTRLYLTAGTRTGPSPNPAVGQGGRQPSHDSSASQGHSSSNGQTRTPASGAGHNGDSPSTGHTAGEDLTSSGPDAHQAHGLPQRNGEQQQQQQQQPSLFTDDEQLPRSGQELSMQLPTEVMQVRHSYQHATQMGELSQEQQSHWIRFRHEVHLQKALKCLSRYDAIAQISKKMHYDNLAKCGHLTFTGRPLQQDTQVLGAVGVEIWVESSTKDADLFVYLEDVDPATKTVRACHRAEYEQPPEDDPRSKAALPGEPFHTFNQKDAADIPHGQAVLCRFQMMPTAYCFARGHHIRVAVSGRDSKHFHLDHPDQQTLWFHAGPEKESAVILETAPL